ncbi:hypothetical protein ACFWJ5_11480 [Streptomyces qaidamensis]|uniref:hypothetical protein n=1 Tax=Streptomyces qaidamensis TaxID=1783515 RepID=UPI003660FB3D
MDARPRRTWAVTALVLAVFAAFSPSLSSQGDRHRPAGVVAERPGPNGPAGAGRR